MSHENSHELFLDTDVAFDIISKREPHFTTSVKLLELSAQGIVQLFISEISLATIFYLSYDIYKLSNATSKLTDFISASELVHSGKNIALLALQSAFRDKEDALQYYTAVHARVGYFITRNIKDYKYKDSSIAVHTPAQFLKIFDRDEKTSAI